MVDNERIRPLNAAPMQSGAQYVLYWMQAAQRYEQNHALCYAAERAAALKLPLVALFVLSEFPDATAMHYRWMLAGLKETAAALRSAGFYFCIRRGEPDALIGEYARRAALLVCDASPSRWARAIKGRLSATLKLAVLEVDGESVIPTALASPKQEWSARTFRLKVSGAFERYLGGPPLKDPVDPLNGADKNTICAGLLSDDGLFSSFDSPQPPAYAGDRAPEQTELPEPGAKAARQALRVFIERRLDGYGEGRNDPLADGCSGLSPYLHFGQLSPIALGRLARRHGGAGLPAFLEQLVIRRELCRNFAWYRPTDYDSWDALPAWSRATLLEHAGDKRSFVYRRKDFEAGATHDRSWNAAQAQLVRTGSIHNYMRMYWGKMILAWSAHPEEAFYTALYLNERYALDGRDPNGWAGVAWCFGLHDRPWPSRLVFGTVRAMAYSGLKRKFDPEAYARRWLQA
jgi:deoxyribodipyrimidine photo-lyase